MPAAGWIPPRWLAAAPLPPVIMAMAIGVMGAPASPCSPRAATRNCTEGAKAQRTEAAVKPTSDTA